MTTDREHRLVACRHLTYHDGHTEGYERAIRDVAAWLRTLETEPLLDGEDRITGTLMVELGAFASIADALESGAWKEQK